MVKKLGYRPECRRFSPHYTQADHVGLLSKTGSELTYRGTDAKCFSVIWEDSPGFPGIIYAFSNGQET